MHNKLPIYLIVFALGISSLYAQLGPPSDASYGGAAPDSAELVSSISWYGVLADGIEESKRTGKPILFVTAAPQCSGVPGIW